MKSGPDGQTNETEERLPESYKFVWDFSTCYQLRGEKTFDSVNGPGKTRELF